MGRYFGNIHAFVGDDDRVAVTNRLASAVSRWVTAGPFREISSEDPTIAHRIMSIEGGPRWISLFCTEATGSEGSALAAQIARDSDLTTLWFRVQDSSLVHMRVYEADGEVDRAVVDVDPADPGMHAPTREPAVDVWERLLVDRRNGEAVREEWNSTGRTVEEKLVAISTLIGLDPSRSESNWPERRSRDETILRFTLTDNAPGLASSVSQPRLCMLPLSAFRIHGTMSAGLGPAPIGQLVSCGGRGRGIRIDVSGTAVERRQLENMRLRIRRGEAGFRDEVVVDVRPRSETVVDDVDIPRGTADLAALANSAALQASAADVLAALSFRLELEAETRLRGDGELRLQVAPIESPGRGVAWTVPVSVS